MPNQIKNLLDLLKEVQRERQFLGLKRYVRFLRRIENRNGKENYIYKGARSYLRRLQYDRRSKSLGLIEYIPFDEPGSLSVLPHKYKCDFKAWIRSMETFYRS